MLDSSENNPCLNENKSLGIDQACLSVVNEYSLPVTLYSVPWDSYITNCYGTELKILPPNSNTTLVTEAKTPLHIYFTVNNQQFCPITYNFRQYGHYGWNLSSEYICSPIYILYESWNPYLPIIAAFMIFALVATISVSSKAIISIIKVFTEREHDEQDVPSRLQEAESISAPIITVSKTSSRIKSVDAFRGIAILLMIFVNNGGGKYYFFNHSPWNGLTIADLVLPWFAWIMGFMILKSVRVSRQLDISRRGIVLKHLRRALILIIVGLMINSQRKSILQTLRFSGVLQLLAITYFICAAVETVFLKPQRRFQYSRFVYLTDILDSWVQWLIIIGISIIHTLLTFLLPVPGCPTGYLGPGGCHNHGEFKNCTGGAAGYIDRLILGSHMYNKTENSLYGHTLPHDPEGIMNTLSAVLIVYLGVQAGRIFFTYYQCRSKMIRWLAWSFVTGLTAGILCNFSKEDGAIPVNKHMMSLSFVLATSSFAFLLFTILHYLIDYKKYCFGTPFIYAGANPILLYIGHYLTMGLFPWAWKLTGVATHTSSLFMNLWTTTLWALIGYGLYKKDIIVNI